MNSRCLLCETLIGVVMICGTVSAANKVVEWKFDGNLEDSSGSGINALGYKTPAYDTGVSGQAFASDGTNCAYITGVDTSILPVLGSDTWSVNVWVYPTVIPESWRIAWCLGNKPSAGGATYKNSRTVYSSGGSITFLGEKTPDAGVTGTLTYTVSSIPWDINQWQMMTTTYDGNIVRIYKNGVLIAMREQTFLDAPGEIRIPSHPWYSSNFFIGKFDEFTVWRGALSVDEIRDLVIPGVIPDVELNQQVIYYQMGDITSSSMPDHSGQGNDGELYGYTLPVTNWIAEGFRGDALLFDGGQAITPPVTVSQPVNYTVSFWFKSGQQPYTSAFYSEKQVDDPGSGWGRGTQLIIRANNDELQAFSKERDYNTLFSIAADASAYLDSVTWNHLAVVADGEAAQARLYVNGQLLTSGPYQRSSHKTTTLDGALGYNWSDGDFLGQWDPTYLDEVKIWNGALNPSQIQAIAAHSNFGNDLKVDMDDLAFMAEEWQLNYQVSPGSIYVADDMEGSLYPWSIHSSSTGTISQTTNAYAGTGALQWHYDIPATDPNTDPNNNYTSIVFDFGETNDLSGYDELRLWLYRHAGNTPENLMYLKFVNADMQVKAEDWLVEGGSVVEPVEEWAEWVIDPNSLLGPRGVGTASEGDLKDIRYLLIGTGSSDRTDARSGIIDLDQIIFTAYPVCSGRPAADVNYDCKVDIQDLLIISEEWLFGTE